MTVRLDRLEHAGLIERTPDPADRRAVLVVLTEPGKRLADQALRTVLAVDEAFLEPLDPAQRADAAALLKSLLVHCERGLPCNATTP